jgi:hypothetical protein
MIMGASIGHGTLLKRRPKFQPDIAFVIVNQSIINHVLMLNVQNWLIKGSRLDYGGCWTQVFKEQEKGIFEN